MKPVLKALGVAVTSASLLMTSGCLGSFSLTKKIYKWNEHATGERWVNEIIFIVGLIVPVYSLTLLADGIIFNSIQWWTGSNPVADAGTQKHLKGADGSVAVMTLNADGSILVDATNAKGEKTQFTLTRDHDNVVASQIVSQSARLALR